MESGEIINNSYKGFEERTSNENNINRSKICSKKIIIISISISIIIISLTIFLLYYFIIKQNSEDKKEKEKIICDPGYYLPEDDPSKCLKCSEENCKNCSGTKSKDTCNECFPGYILQNSFCEIAHSIKAIYYTKEDNINISLMHYIYKSHIKKMIVDNQVINETNTEFNFLKNGSHIVLYSFDNNLKTLGEMFYGNEYLKEIYFSYLFDTSKITSFSFMFYSCRNLLKIEIPYFNTANVEIMSGMFQLCSSLTSINISSFDTKSVTSMMTMFSGCSSLKSLDLSNFNTKNLNSMSNMFQGCYNLTYINLKNFDTKNVYNLNYLFDQCYSLTSIDLRNFNISKVDYMQGMFEDCRAITSLDLSNFISKNDSKMDYMFFGCNNLKYLDVSGFSSNKNVTIFYGLPNGGKIIVEKNFSELIKEQIPNDWEFVIKNKSFYLFE